MKKKVISYFDKDHFFPLLPPAASSAITWCCCAALQSWFGWLQSNCCEHVTFCQTSTTMLILWPRFCGVVVREADLIRFRCVLNLWPARGCFDCARPSDYPHTVWHSVTQCDTMWHSATSSQCDKRIVKWSDCCVDWSPHNILLANKIQICGQQNLCSSQDTESWSFDTGVHIRNEGVGKF